MNVSDERAASFWARVDRGGPDECWEWLGARQRNGYGACSLGKGRMRGAHRIAYAITHGSIPPGLVVAHSCDNPPCVNPAHLRACTQEENLREAWTKGRGHHNSVGEKCWRSDLTEGHVHAIRALRDHGVPVWQVAEWFGIGPAQVTRIYRRESWAHV